MQDQVFSLDGANTLKSLQRSCLLNSKIQGTWATLPADLGRCGNQDNTIVLEAALDSSLFCNTCVSHFKVKVSQVDIALSCFLILLHRHTNQTSISIGVRFSSKSVLPITFEFEDHTVFTDVIAAVSDNADRAISFDITNELLKIPTTFCLQNEKYVEGTPDIQHAGGLSLLFQDLGEVFVLRLVFDGRSFLVERMREFFDQYQLLIKQAIASPQRRVLEYSLITDFGRAILPDPTQDISAPRYPLLPEVFSTIAATYPTNKAIRHAGKSWSYQELDRSSRNLAYHLRQIGVVPGAVVAVTGPRSFGVVSSILGVFRSGGTLLTIDPKLPIERQRIILKQAEAQYLVCVGEADAVKLQVHHLVRVGSVTGAVEGVVDCFPSFDLPALVPTDPAYIFFTSGSTGTPKGVLGTHQGLAHFLDWQRKTFGIGSGDCAAQMTALSFDMVLRDMFLALSSGATLCIPNEADVLDPSAILAWMASERISILHVVPTLLRAWLNYVPPTLHLPDLRRVFLAGEPLTDTLILNFRSAFGDTALITNFYGPTETTLIKCFHSVVVPEPGVQPVGRPLPQTQALVLNRQGVLCGINEIGQIAIRTPFRTLGYLNAPEATALVFVPNPFCNDPGDLLYMTGDSGYYRADGLLVMKGRIDNQIKIRGVRVEPGEIEAAIGHFPGVNEAAVIAHENANGDKFLAAYLVLNPDIAVAAVRDFLRARLPENMVPTAFEVLEALPLLPNGKVNRQALKAPAPALSSRKMDSSLLQERDRPKNSKESELLVIWQSVLGHNRVGVNDSFVELGGDSLTAIAALVRMQRLGIPDSFAKGIFQGWSIRQITAMADGEEQSDQAIAMTPKAKTNLLVNVLRGILVSILVAGHWCEGLLNRLPDSLRGVQDSLLPVFHVATPGFAILFGLGLGYIYYPKYLSDPVQAVRSLRLGVCLVVGGILIRSASDIAILIMTGSLNNSTDFFNTFYSALLYYAIAIASAPVWFRLILKSTNPYKAISGMVIISYLAYQIGQHTLLHYEQSGFLQLLRLMLVAKFNYFNMSVGALSGLAAGIYLHRWSMKALPLQVLTGRAALIGVLACSLGLVLLYGTSGSFQGLKDGSILPAWKWIFYGGTLLLAASFLSITLSRYEKTTMPMRLTINLFGVLGQISLPVFVFHQLVLRVKALLVFAGVPDAIALVLPLFAFLALCGWMMSRLYELYYGSIITRSTDERAVASAIGL